MSTEEQHTERRTGARAALAHRNFRTMFAGSFGSNIGTWMQNVILGAYVYDTTESPTFVSLIQLAQLGPMLLLSPVGGVLADRFDRRRLLLLMQSLMAGAAAVLAYAVAHGPVGRPALFGLVLVSGVFQALAGPSMQAFVPRLVPRELVGSAIALNSAQMNAARVIGPAIAGVLLAAFGTAFVFAANAATFAFVIAAVWVIRLPPDPGPRRRVSVVRQLADGVTVVRRDPFVGRVLGTVFLFSLLCLPFIGQMPTIAAENLGIAPRSVGYALLYAGFGVGAVIGAASLGTFLGGARRGAVVVVNLFVFAAALGSLALLRVAAPAYPVVIVVGFSYFAAVTALNTSLQEHLTDELRGRVMALWLMAFGGTVPIGLMIAGPIAERWSISTVLAYGTVAAVVLAVSFRRWERGGRDAGAPALVREWAASDMVRPSTDAQGEPDALLTRREGDT